jgi:hypothetical protein
VAHIWADRVAETSTTTGTGALTLAGAIAGFRAFSAVCSTNDTVIYAIEGVNGSGVPTGEWEAGVGTYSGVNTLTRTTVIASSNSNSAVTLSAGTKNVFLDDIASTRNTLQQYAGTSEPSAPVEGLIHFAKDFNGWRLPWSRDTSYRSAAPYPFLTGRAFVGQIMPRPNGAATDNIGLTPTVTNSLAIAPATTDTVTRFARLGLNTTSVSTTAAQLRDAGVAIYRGTHSYDGFRCVFRFDLDTVGNTNCRWFVGLLNQTSATTASFDPAASAQIEVGVGATSTDTANMKLYYNDNVGAPSTVDLGANYPAKTARGGIVELVLWAESSASAIKYQVRRLDDLTIAPTTGSLSSDIPSTSTQLNPHFTINNNATAAQSVLAVAGFYMEQGF